MLGYRVPLLSALFALAACGGPDAERRPDPAQEFQWAFAQDLDGSFNRNEFCRRSLAQSLYSPENKERTMRQGSSNVFLFSGVAESYRIYAFESQKECETALTHMMERARDRLR